VPLEKLHSALVILSRFFSIEGSEVSTAAGFRILLTRIQTVLTGLQFANHVESPAELGWRDERTR